MGLKLCIIYFIGMFFIGVIHSILFARNFNRIYRASKILHYISAVWIVFMTVFIFNYLHEGLKLFLIANVVFSGILAWIINGYAAKTFDVKFSEDGREIVAKVASFRGPRRQEKTQEVFARLPLWRMSSNVHIIDFIALRAVIITILILLPIPITTVHVNLWVGFTWFYANGVAYYFRTRSLAERKMLIRPVNDK